MVTRVTRPGAGQLLAAVLAGAAVSVVLGVYGHVHDPTGRAVTTFGFSSVIVMKVWLSCLIAALAMVQLGTALRIYGRIGSGRVPGWVPLLHRGSGGAAVVISLPVAYHCLWSLGFSTFDARTTAHSLLGCGFYGAFVAKMLVVKSRRVPGWALPVLGGLTFAVLVTVWLTSALWYFTQFGVPSL